MFLETPIVITGDDNLVLVGEGPEPLVEFGQFYKIAVSAHVARHNQNVAVRHLDLSVECMAVTECYNPHPGTP